MASIQVRDYRSVTGKLDRKEKTRGKGKIKSRFFK